MAAENRLLNLLPDDVMEYLRPSMEVVRLETGQVLAEDGCRLDHAYFPRDAVCSVLIYGESGNSLEVGLIGPEGVITTSTFLGDGTGVGEVIVQMPGSAYRVPVSSLRRTFDQMPPLRNVLLRYTQAYLTQVAQSWACNSLHSVKQRCARWLLMMSDRVDADELELSQGLLARMLGVGRPTVSIATAALRNANVIRFSRGRLTILDRPGLEESACACYSMIASEMDRLLPNGAASSSR